jgi:hypothetical protein
LGVQAQKKLIRLWGKDCWTAPFWRRRRKHLVQAQMKLSASKRPAFLY